MSLKIVILYSGVVFLSGTLKTEKVARFHVRNTWVPQSFFSHAEVTSGWNPPVLLCHYVHLFSDWPQCAGPWKAGSKNVLNSSFIPEESHVVLQKHRACLLVTCFFAPIFCIWFLLLWKIPAAKYARSDCIVKWVDGCRDGLLVPENCLITWVTTR